MLPTVTIQPRFRSIIDGTTARLTRMQVIRLRSRMMRTSSIGISTASLTRGLPAFSAVTPRTPMSPPAVVDEDVDGAEAPDECWAWRSVHDRL